MCTNKELLIVNSSNMGILRVEVKRHRDIGTAGSVPGKRKKKTKTKLYSRVHARKRREK
jgi:hypothetical protein